MEASRAFVSLTVRNRNVVELLDWVRIDLYVFPVAKFVFDSFWFARDFSTAFGLNYQPIVRRE